jgi:hypothetical protein
MEKRAAEAFDVGGPGWRAAPFQPVKDEIVARPRDLIKISGLILPAD